MVIEFVLFVNYRCNRSILALGGGGSYDQECNPPKADEM